MKSEFKENRDYIILIHGYMRSSSYLRDLGNYLNKNEFNILYLEYPSFKYGIEEVVSKSIIPKIESINSGKQKIHFVTHSAGGVVVRALLKNYEIKNLGRVVMIAPPNKGSEVADFIYQTPILKNIFGPIVNDLRAEKNSFVNSLGPVNFDLGIIAGNKSWNLIGSYIIPGEDDGRVSVENTKVDGYKDHLVVERTHTFIVYAIEVKEAVLKFIKEGSF